MEKVKVMSSRVFTNTTKAKNDINEIIDNLPEPPNGLELFIPNSKPRIEDANRDDAVNVGLGEFIMYFLFNYAPNGYIATREIVLTGEEELVNDYISSLDL